MTQDITVTIETPTDREVVVTRVFEAPRQLVFDALTRPDLIKRWYGPPGAIEVCESDARPGGAWRFVSRMRGKVITQYGVYREVEAPKRFVRTERWEDWDPGETVCTTELTEQHGRTTMTSSMVFPTKEVRDVVLKGGLTPKGTSEFYERLDTLLGSNARASITITPVRVADLLAEGQRMPVYVHLIDHPAARVLVDTGMTELHPAVADLDPRIHPLSEQDFDLAGIDIVVNTHLHFDHCGGNHLFAGRPIYVQRRELDDARSEDDYTIREWVDAPGVRYVPVDGELELLPGLRLVPAPGHTRGMQVVVVETGGRPVVVGGDVAVWFGELDEPHTEGQLRVRALDPELVWLAHEHEPWRPRTV